MFNLREMEAKDILHIAHIESECFLISPWNEQMISSDFKNPYSHYLVVEDRGVDSESGEVFSKVVAYGGFHGIFDEAEITRIAVLPEYRKNGLASMILTELIENAKRTGIARLMLEVRISNVGAIALYNKFGFKTIHTRKNYYEGTVDAYVMECIL